MIYFLRDENAVKIGYTQDATRLAARLHSLRCGNPRELELAALLDDGGPRTERTLHQLLGPWRIRGEWFQMSTPLQHTLHAVDQGASPAAVVRGCAQAVARSENFRRQHVGSTRGTDEHAKLVRDLAAGRTRHRGRLAREVQRGVSRRPKP